MGIVGAEVESLQIKNMEGWVGLREEEENYSFYLSYRRLNGGRVVSFVLDASINWAESKFNEKLPSLPSHLFQKKN